MTSTISHTSMPSSREEEEDVRAHMHCNQGIVSDLATVFCGAERPRYNDGTVSSNTSSPLSTNRKRRRGGKRRNRSAISRKKRKQKKSSAFVTKTNRIKDFCHTYKSEMAKSLSSKRTQAAALASISHDMELSKKGKRNAQQRSTKRKHKQSKRLLPVLVPEGIPFGLTDDDVGNKGQSIVFDGGNGDNPSIPVPPGVKSSAVRVEESVNLYIPDCPADKGLIFPSKDNSSHPFIKIPRNDALGITKMSTSSNDLCKAMKSAIMLSKHSETRGDSRETFSSHPVCNIGVQACRGKRGLSSDNNEQIRNMNPDEFDTIINHIGRCEQAFNSFADTQVIRHNVHAYNCNKWDLPKRSDGTIAGHVFPSINLALNAYLRLHTDEDITHSIVSVHLPDHHYKNDDRIVAYFVFPTLRVAVPLRPGDLLIFNPLVPHCLSSRCRSEDNVFTHSVYLKTSVVGLNDNHLPLTDEQNNLVDHKALLMEEYNKKL